MALESLALTVTPGTRADATGMIRQHYLGKWPGVVVRIYLLRAAGLPVGVCVFALPPRETARRYDTVVWELARLWVDDTMPRNTETWFVARCIAALRRGVDVKALVSYADPSVGHVGTIYRAGNWLADGRTDDERKTPRFDYAVDGKVYSRRGHIPPGVAVTRVPRVSKYRYVLGLNKWEHRRLERLIATRRPKRRLSA